MVISNCTLEFSRSQHIRTDCVLDALIAVEKIKHDTFFEQNCKDLKLLLQKLKRLGVCNKKKFTKGGYAQENVRGFFCELFHIDASLDIDIPNEELFSLVNKEYENLYRVAAGAKDADFVQAQDFCVALHKLLSYAKKSIHKR